MGRRLRAEHVGVTIDPRIFRATDGTWTFFPDCPVYTSRASAKRAWCRPGVRRQVWAASHRMRPPAAAQTFDKITVRGFDELWARLTDRDFDAGCLKTVVRAVNADRAEVARFHAREPAAAKSIAAALDLWLQDLDRIEAAAKMRASEDRLGPSYRYLRANAAERFGPGMTN